jgi:D-sedoheptulose 7-phosphate isomerase
VLLAISTSGTSRNVVAAARCARELGLGVIALTGCAGTPVAELADVVLVTPAGKYADRVQELHIKVIHVLIELVERKLAPQNYVAS